MTRHCERCGAPDQVMLMSMFNTDILCETCLRTERRHPKYQEAREAERAQVLAGNRNFLGIGLPEDLEVKR